MVLSLFTDRPFIKKKYWKNDVLNMLMAFYVASLAERILFICLEILTFLYVDK